MYKLPKEVIQGFVELGYDKEDIENVDNIDLGTVCLDLNTNEDIVTYALYTDADGGGDIVEVTVDTNDWFIEQNGETIKRGECYYDIDVDREESITETITVDPTE